VLAGTGVLVGCPLLSLAAVICMAVDLADDEDEDLLD
jgi:hypothetical protein